MIEASFRMHVSLPLLFRPISWMINKIHYLAKEKKRKGKKKGNRNQLVLLEITQLFFSFSLSPTWFVSLQRRKKSRYHGAVSTYDPNRATKR